MKSNVKTFDSSLRLKKMFLEHPISQLILRSKIFKMKNLLYRRQRHYKIAQQLLLISTLLNVRKVFQILNQFLELLQSVADISHLLKLIVFFMTKEPNLHIIGGWILLNVLNESHTYSSISSYVDLSDIVTSLQHILHTWVLMKLSRVLTQFQLPIQDTVFEETEFLEFEISNSKLLVLLKCSRVIFFEDLESWFGIILSIFKNLGHSKSPESFWVRNKVYIKRNRISSSFRMRIGKHRRSTRLKRRNFRERHLINLI